ncbi:ATP-binding cassette domain-containing protein [Rhodovulum sp. DZ06]|uniref:ATP-binding cassette domain-containing protein n=1 Tax=Rhodovulum sp. DZ06 TaxID=3425126 RepID=UPI003D3551EA
MRKPDPTTRLLAGVAPRLTRAARLSTLAGALWPLQALCVAWSVSAWLSGGLSPAAQAAIAAGFVLIGLLRALLDRRAGAILHGAADEVIAGARARLIAREARAPGPEGSAAIAALAAQKLPLLRPFITRYRVAEARSRALPLLMIALVAPFSWAAALVLLVAGPLIPVFMALVGMAAEDASRRQMVEIGDMNAMLMDRLGALLDVRLLGARERAAAQFDGAADRLRDRTMKVLRVAFLSSTVLELFAALGVAMTAVWVGFSLLGELSWGAWGAPLSPAAGVFVLLLAPEFFQPLRDLAAAWHDRAAARAVAAELEALEEAPRLGMLGTGRAEAPLPGPLSLRLSGAAAHLGGRRVALPDLAITAGEAVALVGPSGAGKSTTLHAVAGLIPLAEGRAEVCGRALDHETADAWRARLSVAPQAPHFGEAALGDWLDMRRTGADPWAALRLARADGVVERLAGGLSARLGETGGGVSGGEARRLMLARAALSGGDLLLADEPTADLDAQTAAQVIAALLALRDRGAALLVATHDPALIAALDRAVEIAPSSGAAPEPAPVRYEAPAAAPAATETPIPLPPVPDASLRPLWRMLRRVLGARPGAMARGAALSALVLLMGVALLGLSGWFITAAAAAGIAGIGIGFDVFRPSAGVRGLALGRAGARYAERLLTHDATLRALADLRGALLRAYAGRGARTLAKLRGAEAINRIVADVEALDGLALRLVLPSLAALVAHAAAALALIVLVGWPVAAAVLAGYAPLALAALLRLTARSRAAARAEEGGLQALRRGVIDMIRDRAALIAAGRLADREGALAACDAAARRAADRLDAEDRDAGALMALAASLAAGLALAAGGWMVAAGEASAAEAAIGVFVALALAETLHPLRRGAAELSRMQDAAARVDESLAAAAPGRGAQTGHAADAEAPAPTPIPGAPALRVVSPRLSFDLPPGVAAALVGPSGAGKTTLLQQIAALDAGDARIEILGHPLSAWPEDALRMRLCMVPQRSALVAGTLRENLALAGEKDDSEMRQALEAAALWEEVAPRGGLDLRLGEGGAGLSGGQARRVCLARALLRRTQVLLLDEPTEGLDRDTAAQVLSGIRAMLPESAILAALHRGSQNPIFSGRNVFIQ